DVPDGWVASCLGAVAQVRAQLDALDAAVAAAPVGVGILDRADALAHGAGGPVGRASGLDLDVRRDDPYSGYVWRDVRAGMRAARGPARRGAGLARPRRVRARRAPRRAGRRAVAQDRARARGACLRLDRSTRRPRGLVAGQPRRADAVAVEDAHAVVRARPAA